MARKPVEIIGDKEVIDALRNSDSVVRQHGKRLLDELGLFGSDMVKAHIIGKGAIDLGELLHGIHYTTRDTADGLETVIKPSDLADNYAIYVEYGTKPHFPPIDKLQGWADRHGIPVYAVAMKIAREGTEGRFMFQNAYNDLFDRTESEVVRWVNNLMREL